MAKRCKFDGGGKCIILSGLYWRGVLGDDHHNIEDTFWGDSSTHHHIFIALMAVNTFLVDVFNLTWNEYTKRLNLI